MSLILSHSISGEYPQPKAQWRYIKGGEADFQDAPDWAVIYAVVKTAGKLLFAYEGQDGRYVHKTDLEKIYNDGGFIQWGWMNKPEIIAQRERVPTPQWRYIKGSEEDFKGAPDWADRIIKIDGLPRRYADKHIYENEDGTFRYTMSDGWTLIAQRERVTESDTVVEMRSDIQLYPDTTQSLIAERGERYGKFAEGAAIMQQLKQVTHGTPGWSRLSDSQKEALDMITHKIGRMLNGDPNYDDNWKDIAGYATLVADELNGVSR